MTANDAVRTAAAWSFHAEGDPAADAWVRVHAQAVLAGGATRVAGTLRRAATRAGLEPGRPGGTDYLLHVATADTTALHDFILEYFAASPAIQHAETSLVFRHLRGTTCYPQTESLSHRT